MSKIPEINIKLETRTVKGGEVIKMTVRNMFYKGFWGKLQCMWYWYWYHSYTKSWNSYLNSPVTWRRELAQDVSTFHSIDAEDEKTRLLNKHIIEEIDMEVLRQLREDKDNWKINEK